MLKKYNLIQINDTLPIPLSSQLAQQLTWMIAGGSIETGEKLPPIRKFSAALGIHMHTVRSAYHLLEEQSLVSIKPKLGTRVLKYEPFISAKTHSTTGNELIAVLIPELSDFYNNVLKGIEATAKYNNIIPVVISCNEDPYVAESVYNTISARGFAGAINLSIGFSDDFQQNFSKRDYLNVPLVFVDNFETAGHRVNPDTSGAVQLAVQHLIKHEYQDIALVNCPNDWPIGREIHRGYLNALNNGGFDFEQAVVFSVPDFSFEAGSFIADQILHIKKIPRAIVTASDALAIGAISNFIRHGLNVPDDIAVIGYNNITLSSFTNPPLTTVALPAYDMGAQAMNILANIIQGKEDKWEQFQFSGKLVIRSSCGCYKENKT